MATTHRNDVEATAYQMQVELALKLRERFPWVRMDALLNVAEETASTLQKQLLAQEQAVNEAKSRIDFFSLSGELRNCSYEEALIKRDGRVELLRPYSGRASTPALLQTSKAIRNEASSIYYSSNIFFCAWQPTTGLYSYIARPLRKWLESIGTARASQIKQLHLVCTFKPLKVVAFSRSGLHGRPTHIPFESKKDVYKALDLERLGVTEDQFRIHWRRTLRGRGGGSGGEIL